MTNCGITAMNIVQLWFSDNCVYTRQYEVEGKS